MDFDTQLKLQAFLDGELSEDEARAVASLIARDEAAKALHAELKNTRKAIKEAGANAKLPETREFFWSKIEREIQRLEPVAATTRRVSPFEALRRLLMPVSAFAVLVVAGLITYNQLGFGGSSHPSATEVAGRDSNAFTYHDYSAGLTLVWMPFPAENDLAQNGSPATIQ